MQFVRRGSRTVAARLRANSPLRLLNPDNHGHAAWVYTSSFGGGLVDGDRVGLHVDVGEGASAFLSTQASTKVYRSPRGTSARLTARVGDRGLFVLAPDPVVCFAGSRFDQHQEFDVAGGGALVVVDWVTSGRRESGERWSFDRYTSRLVGRAERSLIVHDALSLRQDDGDLASRLGRFDVLAIVIVLGDGLRSEASALIDRLRDVPVERRPRQLAVAAALEDARGGQAGCLVRLAGASVEEVGRSVRSYIGFVPDLLGDDPWARKW